MQGAKSFGIISFIICRLLSAGNATDYLMYFYTSMALWFLLPL